MQRSSSFPQMETPSHGVFRSADWMDGFARRILHSDSLAAGPLGDFKEGV